MRSRLPFLYRWRSAEGSLDDAVLLVGGDVTVATNDRPVVLSRLGATADKAVDKARAQAGRVNENA